jgi:stage II sporulation protein D
VRRLFFLVLFIFGIMLGIPRTPITVPPRIDKTPVATDPLLSIKVYYVPTGEVLEMDLEDYIQGVVASEMPASAGIEALKAQAIAARTIAVRKMKVLGGTPSRPDADVTSDHRIDQAWNPESVLREKWGSVTFWLNWPKVVRACQETQGLILTYRGLPCEAVYHSTCAGSTEAAKDVWTQNVPYLQSVSCNFCSDSPHYRPQTVSIPISTVSSALAEAGASIPVSTIRAGGTLAISQVSPTGRVKEVLVNGQKIRGLEFRMALGLRSTRILSFAVKGDSVVFQVKGYGHGVGMCQYGAMGMAKQNRTHQEILAFYYPDTKVTAIFEE